MSLRDIESIVQVLPTDDFKVYVYFANGQIKLYDMKPLIGSGVFRAISEISEFKEKCTVINGTLAWDLTGNRDEYTCLDIDPVTIFENSISVEDPLTAVG